MEVRWSWAGAALGLSLMAGACGPPPSPAPLDAHVVGQVTVRDDTLLGTIFGAHAVDSGAVFAVPADALEQLWREGADPDGRFDLDRMEEGLFETSVAVIRATGGGYDQLAEDGSFAFGLSGGDHLVCFSWSPGEELLRPSGCELMTLPEPPVRLLVRTGEGFSIQVLDD